ncbi:MAG TPA: S8 family serine peptidase [Gaiellaceae bacterium]|nr:S8 family serine peptidase [Gaiellaceae bacterium]
MRLFQAIGGAIAAAFLVAGPALPAIDDGGRTTWPEGSAVVSYTGEHALERALARHPAAIVRRLPALRTVEVQPRGDVSRYAAELAAEPGILGVERAAPRRSLVEPALLTAPAGEPFQWQYAAVHADQVPAQVEQAAAKLTIAVIDTGADLTAPDLAAKSPLTHSVLARSADVTDRNGHGTFVAALAAGSGSNGEGVAGVGGNAQLLVVQAGGATGSFSDVEEATAIVYAVDHGARIINLSLGGPSTSTTERRAIDYAVGKGVLLVAAVGNSFASGNPVEYPAALLQPPGSRGVGGHGLAVGASTRFGTRAPFSSTGSHVSLAAPGESVFSAVSGSSPASRYPRVTVPGSAGGLYGYGSGTSFAAPQVAGAAALVWAANPQLNAEEVSSILEQTASGEGNWNAELGYGVLDVAAAVARAQDPAYVPTRSTGTAQQQASARIGLAAHVRHHAGSARIDVTARLRVAALPGAEGSRTVLLESFDGTHWTRSGTARTDASGRAAWSYSVKPGSYQLRVRSPGTDEVAAATSAAVKLTVR